MSDQHIQEENRNTTQGVYHVDPLFADDGTLLSMSYEYVHTKCESE